MQDLGTITRELYAGIDRRDWSVWDRLISPQVEAEAFGERQVGIVERRAFLDGWIRAFPDVAHRLDRVVVGADTVVLEVTHTGTHTGPLGEGEETIEPTGRTIAWPGCHILRFRDGLVVSNHLYEDRLDLLAQLGLMPEPARSS